jgi:hypothetical protein
MVEGKRRIVIALFLGVALLKLTPTSAFLVVSLSNGASASALKVTRRRDNSIPEIVLPNITRSSESNFWHSVVHKDSEKKLPAARHLDREGPLPPGAYRTFGKEQFEPKDSCAVSIAVDLVPPTGKDTIDSDEIVSGLQKYIDSGLTTFHLGLPSQSTQRQSRRPTTNADPTEDDRIELLCPSNLQTWGEEIIFGKLRRSLPGNVKETSCHLVVPMMTPSAKAHTNHVTRSLVREAITESLSRIGTDSIDTLQLHCK